MDVPPAVGAGEQHTEHRLQLYRHTSFGLDPHVSGPFGVAAFSQNGHYLAVERTGDDLCILCFRVACDALQQIAEYRGCHDVAQIVVRDDGVVLFVDKTGTVYWALHQSIQHHRLWEPSEVGRLPDDVGLWGTAALWLQVNGRLQIIPLED